MNEVIATQVEKLLNDIYIEDMDRFTEIFKHICDLQHNNGELKEEDYKEKLEDMYDYIDDCELKEEYKHYLSYRGKIAGISFFDDEDYSDELGLKISYIEDWESETIYYDSFVHYIDETIYVGEDIEDFLIEELEYMPIRALKEYFDFDMLINEMESNGALYEFGGEYLRTTM